MIKIGSIVIDCKENGKMSTFWREALHYDVGRAPDPHDPEPSSILAAKSGEGPNVIIDQMEPYRGKIHIDLYSDDTDADISRLLKLGAKVHRPHEEGTDFTILEDPEGNLFCVVDARST
jgi:predicted enzyme related to lactoylglutathione lyase